MRRAAFACAVALALALGVVTVACSTLRQAPQVVTMSEPEFERWVSRLAAQASILAEAVIVERRVSAASAVRVAEALDALADGPPTVGVAGALALDLPAWGAAALQLTLLELDAALDESGALDGPGWARGAVAVRAVADAIRRAALEEP